MIPWPPVLPVSAFVNASIASQLRLCVIHGITHLIGNAFYDSLLLERSLFPSFTKPLCFILLATKETYSRRKRDLRLSDNRIMPCLCGLPSFSHWLIVNKFPSSSHLMTSRCTIPSFIGHLQHPVSNSHSIKKKIKTIRQRQTNTQIDRDTIIERETHTPMN